MWFLNEKRQCLTRTENIFTNLIYKIYFTKFNADKLNGKKRYLLKKYVCNFIFTFSIRYLVS